MCNKKIIVGFLLLITSFTFAQPARITLDFNKDWKFFLGNDSTAIDSNFNDASWRTLNLPHDWSIEGAFSETAPATTQGGALPGGIGWYRKTFVLPSNAKNKNVRIEFDGVYRNSEVWINGQYLGKRPNGYISFNYDLSSHIKRFPAKNVIVVKVNNSQQPNSRWYTGSGIYRNTRLILTNDIQFAHWGAEVDAAVITDKTGSISSGTILTRMKISNKSGSSKKLILRLKVYDQQDKLVAVSKPYPFSVDADDLVVPASVPVKHPKLWSTTTPDLYKLAATLEENGKIIDNLQISTGFRSFRFDEHKGFFLNNQSLKIKGVCLHHDLGPLGAAVNTRAMERQLQILKAMGCNAIRTAHNPPAPELLDLCDKMGFLVVDEAFDMWRKKKNKFDYFSDFDQWHKRDLEDMVKRDRNHVSVFMWSIGNEIREQFDSTGISITKELVSIVKAIDDSRPVTAALSEWNPEKNFMYKAGALDVIGLNYHHEVYEDFPRHYPGQKFIGAENMSALATRGHYDFPSDTLMHWPERSPQKYVEKGNKDFTVSAYDQVSAYWGSTHEETWKIIKKHDFLSGLFVWTGFDYLGEPTPYPWPARSSYFGIVDLAGFPKDVYYMYQSEWTSKQVLHIFPHWNWPQPAAGQPGRLVDIWAYYNNADEVELFVNGRSLGVKKKNKDELHVMWRVSYEPGTLKAVSRKNGKNVLVREIYTAGEPASIELLADRNKIAADGNDLSFITVRVLDKNGRLVPGASNRIKFSITGTGTIAATDNGYQADTEPFSSSERNCWKGMALVIVRATEKKGNITLRATAEGLSPAVLLLKTGN
jgi:beta-galactosidase